MDFEFFKQAIEKSPSIVVITNINGEFEYINPKFTEVTGYSLAEVKGKKTSLMKSGELTTEYYREMWDNLLLGKEWKGEFHNKKKNGELYWVSSLISSVKDEDGQIIRFIAVQEDITKIREAQEEIAELNKFQSIVLNTTPNGVIIFEKDGKILFSNKAMEKLVSFNSYELSLMNFFDLIDSAGLVNLILNKFEDDQSSILESELNIIPKRDEPFPVKITISEVEHKERFLALLQDNRIARENEQLLEQFQSIIANETYLSLFCQSRIGPEIYLTDEFKFTKTDKNILSTKIGVYFNTAIGQGANANAGLFGPLPFPDVREYESIVYTSFLKDSQNADPRAKGMSYCMFVVTFPKKFTKYYTNRQYLEAIFENFVSKFDDVRSVKKIDLNDLKISLIK